MEEAAAVSVVVSSFFDLYSAARAQFLAISSWNFLSSRCGLGGEYKLERPEDPMKLQAETRLAHYNTQY